MKKKLHVEMSLEELTALAALLLLERVSQPYRRLSEEERAALAELEKRVAPYAPQNVAQTSETERLT